MKARDLCREARVSRAAIPAGKAQGKGTQRNTMGGFGIHAAHERHEGGGNGRCHGNPSAPEGGAVEGLKWRLARIPPGRLEEKTLFGLR